MKVHQVSQPGLSLKAYENPDMFKSYMNGIGLLNRQASLPAGNGESPFAQFRERKGVLS